MTAKVIKWAGIGMAALCLYTVVGVLTSRLHEARFPGTNCKDGCVYGSQALGFFWPIGLPITLGFYIADL